MILQSVAFFQQSLGFVIDFSDPQPLNTEMDGFKSKVLDIRPCISVHKRVWV